MDSKLDDCASCRTCCKFDKDEIYLAPLLNKEEVEKIEKVYGKFDYAQFKDNKEIFQIQLIKSKTGPTYDCSLLDESSHLCKIYSTRPMDCKIWPFTFMKDKSNKIVLAYYDNFCSLSKSLESKEFNSYLDNFLETHKDLESFIKENKHLALDFQDDASIIKLI